MQTRSERSGRPRARASQPEGLAPALRAVLWGPGRSGTFARPMKAEIHPEYKQVQVHCACGNEFETRSTKESIRVEICSACHPFYTGKQNIVDTAGKVERFRRRYAKK